MAKDLTLRDYYKIFMKNKWFIGIFTFIVSVITIGVSFLLPQWYAGTSRIIRPQSQVLNMSGIQLGSMNLFGAADGTTNRYLSILNSRLLKEQICEEFDLVETYDVKYMDLAVKKFQEKCYNITLGDENQIVITVFDRDQDRVADMSNYVVFLLDSINTSLSTKYGREEKLFIETQMDDILDSLRVLEIELLDYMNENNVLSVNDQIQSEVEYATELKYQILIKETELKIMKQANKDQFLIESQEIAINDLKEQYNELFTNNNDLYLDLDNAPNIAIYIQRMERNIQYFNEVLMFMGPLLEQAKINEAKFVPSFEVLDYAHRPDRKAKPKKAIIVISAFMFALFSSGVYILLKETQEQ